MKIKLPIYLLVFILLATACGNDGDDLKQSNNPGLPFQGTWHLKKVQVASGGNFEYGVGQVSWTFRSGGKLLVEKNIVTTGPEDIHGGFPSGIYDYSVGTAMDGTQILYVDGRVVGEVLSKEKTLFMEEGVAPDTKLKIWERE